MATDVGMCNEALANIGAGSNVTSINPPDGSAYAQHCARFYRKAVELTLAAFPWKFATARSNLAQVVDSEVIAPGNYAYKFALPADMLVAICVLPKDHTVEDDQRLDYEIEGPYLFCNHPTPQLKYTRNITNESLFTVEFADAATWKLSQLLSGVIVKGDVTMRKYCLDSFNLALEHAAAIDASQSRTKPVHVPPWLKR